MSQYKWYTIKCSDCKSVIAYSPYLIPQFYDPDCMGAPIYCALCANAHAQAASWMMPVGNDYGINGLYGVQNQNRGYKMANEFRNLWDKLFAKLQAHQVAKAKIKSRSSINNP